MVDDGSDKTICVVRDYVMRYGTDRIRLLRLTRNLGKGGAVKSSCVQEVNTYSWRTQTVRRGFRTWNNSKL